MVKSRADKGRVTDQSSGFPPDSTHLGAAEISVVVHAGEDRLFYMSYMMN